MALDKASQFESSCLATMMVTDRPHATDGDRLQRQVRSWLCDAALRPSSQKTMRVCNSAKSASYRSNRNETHIIN